MPERLKPLFDKDTGLLALVGGVLAGLTLSDVDVILRITCGIGGVIIMLPKVIRTIRNWKSKV